MKKFSSASAQIFSFDAETLRQRAARTQTAQGDHNDFLMQWGKKVPNLMTEGEATFVALSSYTGLDKGLVNTKGIGLSSKGQPVPEAIRKHVSLFEETTEIAMYGKTFPNGVVVPALEPGEDKIMSLGSCIPESSRRAKGIALAMELGLSEEDAEYLADTFLRPDSSQWGVKVYRRKVNKPAEENKSFKAIEEAEDLSALFA